MLARFTARSNLAPIFARYATDGAPGESFGDYCNRVGTEQLVTMLPTQTVRRRRSTASELEDAS